MFGDEEVMKEASILEEKAYRDTWGYGLESFIQMLFDRFQLMRDLLDSGTQFRVDYLKPSGAIGFYHPDWVVVQKIADGEVNWIIETKGRVWEGTEAKDDAIRYWCEQVSKSTGKPWRYARVNQPIFDTQKPKTLQEATSGKGISSLVLL